MIPVLFHIGPLTVYSYGLMMAVGFLAADFVIALECKRRGINPDYASSVVVWAAILGIVGSRVYDIFDNLSYYLADPKSMIFSGSGFVWYGGLFGGIFATWLVARRYKIPWLKTADMCAPALAVGQAFGRIGCHLSGDGDWGLPSNLPWAVSYTKAIVGWNSATVLKLDDHYRLVSGYFPGVRVHPAPLYETTLYFIVFAILWSLRKKVHPDGRLLYLYLMLGGLSRFIVEFVRINPRVFYGLSEAQLIAIGMMLTGAVAWYFSGERRDAMGTQEAIRA
ncbi:MAG TPA: prolipoprotein diacylglyceryl transferase [Candidatus Binataceae bacterium]